MHTNAILGINSCKPVKECRGRAVSLATPRFYACCKVKIDLHLIMCRGTAVLLLWMKNCQEHGSTREGMAGRRVIISHTNIPLLYAWYGITSGQL